MQRYAGSLRKRPRDAEAAQGPASGNPSKLRKTQSARHPRHVLNDKSFLAPAKPYYKPPPAPTRATMAPPARPYVKENVSIDQNRVNNNYQGGVGMAYVNGFYYHTPPTRQPGPFARMKEIFPVLKVELDGPPFYHPVNERLFGPPPKPSNSRDHYTHDPYIDPNSPLYGQNQPAAYGSGTSMFTEHGVPRYPDPEIDLLLQAYNTKYGQDLEPYDADDEEEEKELLCICYKPDDNRVYIRCDNASVCPVSWFHPSCIGMTGATIPDSRDTWYCPDCIKMGRGGAGKLRKMTAYMIQTNSAHNNDSRSGSSATNKIAGHVPVIDLITPIVDTHDKRTASFGDLPVPTLAPKPWSSEIDKKFANNAANLRDLGVSTREEAINTLRRRAAESIKMPVLEEPKADSVAVTGTVVKQPNKNSWTPQEDNVLIKIVREANAAGLFGNGVWAYVDSILPNAELGRPMGAARNRWMRGLREQTQIDERRKKNANKLTTAVQGPKTGKSKDNDGDATTPKRRYKVSRKANDPAAHKLRAMADSSPAVAATPATGANRVIQSSPVRVAPKFESSPGTTVRAVDRYQKTPALDRFDEDGEAGMDIDTEDEAMADADYSPRGRTLARGRYRSM